MSKYNESFEAHSELSNLLSGVLEESVDMDCENFPFTSEFRSLADRYGNCSELNHGGMKRIEVVQDNLTGSPVAKATLIDQTNPDAVEAFFREARITAALKHPNIITVYDIGFDENERPFFMMELLAGDCLQTVLTKLKNGNRDYLKRYPLNVRLNIFLKICDAISYAHSYGVVHLDLKPENIQLGQFGEVYVCDWGLAKIISDDREFKTFDTGVYNIGTLSGDIKGTPGYMAPEQIKKKFGKKGKRTDVFSLGALLFSLLNLTPPFAGEDLKTTLNNTISKQFTDWDKKLPQSLKAVCMKAMSLKRAQRYPTVDLLSKEIIAYLNGFATAAEDAGFISQLKHFINRNKRISYTVFLSTIILFITSSIFVKKLKQNEKEARLAQKNAETNLKRFKTEQRKAEKAYTLYSGEKKMAHRRLLKIHESENLKQQNLPTLILLSRHYISIGSYENAVKLLKTVIRLHPDHSKALTLLGEAYLFQFEFAEAAVTFEKIGAIKYNELSTICEKYVKLKADSEHLPDEHFTELLTELNSNNSLKNYAIKLIEMLPLVDYRESFIPLLEKSLEILNPKQEILNFTVERKEGKNYIDLSNNPGITNIKPLNDIYIHSLNLRNSGVKNLNSLPNKPKLYALDLSGTNFTNVLQLVRGFPGLKELTISDGQFTDKEIGMLPRALKLIYR